MGSRVGKEVDLVVVELSEIAFKVERRRERDRRQAFAEVELGLTCLKIV